MITIENLSFQYQDGKGYALRDVNLTVKEGDFIGIIGISGAGKSTLTYAINGIIPHHYAGDFYGSVQVGGMDTVEVRPENLSKLAGSVFQDIDGQMVASIVEDELLFGLENFGFPREEIEERLSGALETVGIADLRHRAIRSLSGGQKQKVAIASIVALRPKILLLDEPTGELDPQSSVQIFEMLRSLNRDYGMTVIVVEQKIMLLCEYADRLLVMDGGGIAFDGQVRAVLQNAAALEALGINIPRVATLANRLRERGLCDGALPVNLDEAEKMVREVVSHAAV
ncbi:energy-coupling factor ABC transporter ATP-binding protein [Anaerotruncus rubiinfantis]|uniref:energy-coupling factor ABC transporter ATP-binding protein n=1 Tax=Anaerotruncus rubiinfantis TaxID=1720200 RepID=UPI0011C86688|nr:ATP-binding cassette domain-containing protein [Anaerotruncus rubiinfantis]